MMQVINQSEYLILLVGLAILVFIWLNREEIRHLSFRKVLLAAFCVLVVGWILSIIEELLWEELLNFMQHLCFAISSFLVALWSWMTFKKQEESVQR
ncbi:MAG: hypothetical protein ACFFBD_20500 [Candidatus Hodarchaeota archaeon]